MGKIVLDNRGAESVLTFRVGNGRKQVIKHSVTIPKGDNSALLAEVTAGLVKLRPTRTS